jgi:hypothetical protein
VPAESIVVSFAFEKDYAGDLQTIPRLVRSKRTISTCVREFGDIILLY